MSAVLDGQLDLLALLEPERIPPAERIQCPACGSTWGRKLSDAAKARLTDEHSILAPRICAVMVHMEATVWHLENEKWDVGMIVMDEWDEAMHVQSVRSSRDLFWLNWNNKPLPWTAAA